MSNGKDKGGPAFPRQFSRDDAYGIAHDYDAQEGMTLRDYFAAKAMQAMYANPVLLEVVTSGSVLDGSAGEKVARKSYEIADQMLKARNS